MTTGIVQVRIADALCTLVFFTPAAIPGVFIGCLVANAVILSPNALVYLANGMVNAPIMDIFIGSAATLVGCFLGYLIRKNKFLVSIPPIILNTITIVLLFKFAYRYEDSALKCFCTVGVGELIACGLMGTALMLALEDSWYKWFPPKDGANKTESAEETESVKKIEPAEENAGNITDAPEMNTGDKINQAGDAQTAGDEQK